MKASDEARLLATLESRFEKNPGRHEGIDWSLVEARLKTHPEGLQTVYAKETTAGEPDVIGYDRKTGTVTFCDCSAESPTARR
jgi:hypothetical protein